MDTLQKREVMVLPTAMIRKLMPKQGKERFLKTDLRERERHQFLLFRLFIYVFIG